MWEAASEISPEICPLSFVQRPAGIGLALRIKEIPAALSFTRTAGIFIFGTRDAWRKAGDELSFTYSLVLCV